MILALLWLTISIPFVYASQQELAKESKSISKSSPLSSNEEESSNPFSNSTEEKTPSSSSLTEEFLHDHHVADLFFSVNKVFYACEDAGTYIAFHGELLVPPPNAA